MTKALATQSHESRVATELTIGSRFIRAKASAENENENVVRKEPINPVNGKHDLLRMTQYAAEYPSDTYRYIGRSLMPNYCD